MKSDSEQNWETIHRLYFWELQHEMIENVTENGGSNLSRCECAQDFSNKIHGVRSVRFSTESENLRVKIDFPQGFLQDV